MSNESLMMEGKLSGLKRDLIQQKLRVENLCISMRTGLNTALTPVDELDVAGISQQSRDFVLAFVEMQKTISLIERLKKELGRG